MSALDNSLQTVFVGGMLQITASAIYIIGLNHIISKMIKVYSQFKVNDTDVLVPHRLAMYMPDNCTLNEYELEILEVSEYI